MNRTTYLVLSLIALVAMLNLACESNTSVEADTESAPASTQAEPDATPVVRAEPAEPADEKTPVVVAAAPEDAADAAPAGEEPAEAEASVDVPGPENSAEAITPDTVLATVGESKITAGEVQEEFSTLRMQMPPQQAAGLSPRNVLDALMRKDLMEAFIAKHNLAYDEEEFEKIKTQMSTQAEQMGMTLEQAMSRMGMSLDDLKMQMKLQAYLEEKTSTEKLRTFASGHKNCFDGTKVSASHVLIMLPPAATTAQQKEALAKLKALKKQIEAGEVTFAEAAKQNSNCGSATEGGDLGEFAFQQMVPPFALKAFEMKEDEISDPVRTQFGFHIIKKTGETKPEDAKPVPAEQAEQVAKQAIASLVINDIMDLALNGQTIAMTEKGNELIPPSQPAPLPGLMEMPEPAAPEEGTEAPAKAPEVE